MRGRERDTSGGGRSGRVEDRRRETNDKIIIIWHVIGKSGKRRGPQERNSFTKNIRERERERAPSHCDGGERNVWPPNQGLIGGFNWGGNWRAIGGQLKGNWRVIGG